MVVTRRSVMAPSPCRFVGIGSTPMFREIRTFSLQRNDAARAGALSCRRLSSAPGANIARNRMAPFRVVPAKRDVRKSIDVAKDEQQRGRARFETRPLGAPQHEVIF